MTAPLECPKCHADLRETIRFRNEDVNETTRVVGVVENDRVVRWRCPDCGAEWERSFGTVRQTPKPPPMRRPSDEAE